MSGGVRYVHKHCELSPDHFKSQHPSTRAELLTQNYGATFASEPDPSPVFVRRSSSMTMHEDRNEVSSHVYRHSGSTVRMGSRNLGPVQAHPPQSDSEWAAADIYGRAVGRTRDMASVRTHEPVCSHHRAPSVTVHDHSEQCGQTIMDDVQSSVPTSYEDSRGRTNPANNQSSPQTDDWTRAPQAISATVPGDDARRHHRLNSLELPNPNAGGARTPKSNVGLCLLPSLRDREA